MFSINLRKWTYTEFLKKVSRPTLEYMLLLYYTLPINANWIHVFPDSDSLKNLIIKEQIYFEKKNVTYVICLKK